MTIVLHEVGIVDVEDKKVLLRQLLFGKLKYFIAILMFVNINGCSMIIFLTLFLCR